MLYIKVKAGTGVLLEDAMRDALFASNCLQHYELGIELEFNAVSIYVPAGQTVKRLLEQYCMLQDLFFEEERAKSVGGAENGVRL